MKKAPRVAKRLDSATTKVVRRLDLGELRPAIRREDGTMLVDAHLTRCGVFNYLQPDGTIRRELREPEQVFAPESLNSFVGRPVTNEHPPEMIDAKNATKYAIGAVQGDVIRDDDHVRSRLSVYDHDTIQAMQNGKRQVSLGYVCDLDETGGVHPQYGHYDARQINIRGNHCAIVDAARAGGTARVRLDAAERVSDQFADKWTKAGFKRTDDASRRQGRRKLVGMGMRCDDYSPDEPRGADGKWGGGGGGGGGGGAKSSSTSPKDIGEIMGRFYKQREKTASDASAKAGKENTFAAHAEAMKAHLIASGANHFQGPDTSDQGTAHVTKAAEHLKAAEKAAKPEDAKALADLRDQYKTATQAYAYKSYDSVDAGTKNAKAVADRKKRAKVDSMAKTGGSADTSGQKDAPSSQEGDPKMGTTDPKDVASRNAAGDDDADPKDKGEPAAGPESEDVRDSKARAHGEDPDDDDPESQDPDDPDDDDDDFDEGDDDPDDDDDDDSSDEGDDDDDRDDDAYDVSYNDDGELTPEARHKMATTSFAVPDREGLPIHDPAHTRAAMARFNQYDFKTPDEKHAAFNRITERAKHFGISSDGFQRAHKTTLDRQDQDRAMIKNEKLRKAREERDTALTRIDALEGQIASLKKDLANKTRVDSTDEVNAKVDAKVKLIAEARETGATIDPTKSPIEIKRAVVKHVDGDDIDPKKSEDFVDGVYQGALKRARQDAADVRKGEEALGKVRAAAAATPVQHDDADDTDEDAVAARALAHSASMHEQPWESPYDRHTTRLDSKRPQRLGNRDSE